MLMKFFRRLVFVFSLSSLLSVMMISGAYASIVTTGCVGSASCTLDELYAGGTIAINDVLFSGWTLNPNAFGDDQGLTGSEFLVTGNDESAGALGLNFLANPALSFELLDYDFDFNVSIISPSTRLITSIALDMLNSTIIDDAFIEVNSDLDIGSGFGNGDFLQVTDVLNPSMGNDILSASIMLASLTSIAVDADIQMEQFENELPILAEFEYTFTVAGSTEPPNTVPEPAALFLLIMGGIGVSLKRRKQVIANT